MKVIISHDIDHITAWEHYNDLIIPKSIIRNSLEFIKGVINIKEYLGRYNELLMNKWQYIDELLEFDKENGVKSTFFLGVNNGLGLAYKLDMAKFWVIKIINQGFETGVHGICYDDFTKIKYEFDTFKKISGLDNFGIRLHYLRSNSSTLNFLEQAGYLFDSTIFELSDPYKINNMWEFPLHIMDSCEIYGNKRWQTKSFEKIKDLTKYKIEEIIRKNIKYITVLFRDRYFTNYYLNWIKWYIWIIEWFKMNKFIFINYKSAIKELEKIK